MNELLKQSRLIYFYLLVGFISIVGCTNDESFNIPEVEDTNLVFESFADAVVNGSKRMLNPLNRLVLAKFLCLRFVVSE